METPKPGRKNRRHTKKLAPAVPHGPRTKLRVALAILKWTAIGLLALFALGAATLALLFWLYGRDPNLPRIDSLSDYRPKQVTRVVTPDGHVIGEIFTERRSFVPYEKVPKLVVDAFIAAEDAKFWEHEGIDYIGMVRALIVNLRAGKKKQGASTI